MGAGIVAIEVLANSVAAADGSGILVLNAQLSSNLFDVAHLLNHRHLNKFYLLAVIYTRVAISHCHVKV